ncbi:saccharopine dehydrogenase NADP-binding domain-containing protein [Sphaerisporangium flaviroseum]|uniref:Saccharopine dehydrogenase NADP-binding domain-containing protein n=1 Tax=Sphaerisporangium flaviroseum TaxID=509199 RepID=A0ABP7IHX7_9ACTN
MTTPLIAIYGANGHTGRLVAAELRSRGYEVVLAGRDAAALRTMADELGARAHVATLDDPASLRELAESASVLIHCAGPFSVTGEPVAAAAAEAGCHYVDHAVEPHHVKRMFDTFQAPAQRTGATMIPALSFYGGLGDLLAAAVADGMSLIDRMTIAYAVTGWRLTTGALHTARQLFAETDRISYSDGALSVGYVEPRNAVFAFPPPLGPRSMIAPVPFPEVVTIPRHLPVRQVEAMLTARTFEEEHVFDSEDLDAEARSRTDFTVAVQAIGGRGGRAGQVAGHDLWRAGALASVEAAVRLAGDEGPAKSGVLSAAEAFAAEPFLRTLERLGAFTITL